MTMKKVRIDSADDLESLPEGEWLAAPDGINVPFRYDHVRLEGRELRIRLPPQVIEELRPKRGRRLRARIAGEELVVDEVR